MSDLKYIIHIDPTPLIYYISMYSTTFNVVAIMRHDYTNKQWKNSDSANAPRRLKLRYVFIAGAIIIIIGIILVVTDHHEKTPDTHNSVSTKTTTSQPHYHTIQLTVPPKES